MHSVRGIYRRNDSDVWLTERRLASNAMRSEHSKFSNGVVDVGCELTK